MKKRLSALAKLAAVVAVVYVSLRIVPAEGWYVATAVALVWLFGLSKELGRVLRAPTIPYDRSATMSLVMPPPLRAKYVFRLQVDPAKVTERLQLTTDERAAFQQCERWPKAIQVDQWGPLLRWRLFMHGGDIAGEWDTKPDDRDDRIVFWETPLAPGNDPLFGARLVLDWAAGRLRLFAERGRFNVATRSVFAASLDHTNSVFMDVSFPYMERRDRAAYRDSEHYDFMEKHGWEFPHLNEAEQYHGKSDGAEWWASLYDYRPEVRGVVVKSRTVEKHPVPEWRTQFFVEIGHEGERRWLPSDKFEPDKTGNTTPPAGAAVTLTLTLNDEGELEVARVRPASSDGYGPKSGT